MVPRLVQDISLPKNPTFEWFSFLGGGHDTMTGYTLYPTDSALYLLCTCFVLALYLLCTCFILGYNILCIITGGIRMPRPQNFALNILDG